MRYFLNGIDFKDYGIYVKESRGILDGLELKEPLELNWPDHHGKVVDLSVIRYDVREITLECFSLAVDKSTSVQKMADFFNELAKAGTQRLMIDTGEVKPLVYEVYRKGAVSVTKHWQGAINVGSFTLKLTEPEPVKRVLKHIRTSTANKQVTVTFTSEKQLTFFWGDGAKSVGRGTNITLTHDYLINGTYYIIIAGVIDEISGQSTNASVIWNSL